MEITNRSILVLGGWGLVGAAVCRELMAHSPSQLIITSLFEHEAKDAVAKMQAEFAGSSTEFVPAWGNIFVREDWKDTSREALLADSALRIQLIEDIIDELSEEMLKRSALYTLIDKYKPAAVIDCINTATAIAYQDVYSTARTALRQAREGNIEAAYVERMLASLYIPQLIRHIQILNRALRDSGSKMYVKIGTSGTGGMGLNIPYTHSEERPSRVLLSKSSVAGAHTLLLFLMARTPDGPFIKEIKPTATIGWKRIAHGDVLRKGKPIALVDMPVEKALPVEGEFVLRGEKPAEVTPTGKNLQSPFIDTGENGIFSRGEFEAITAAGQMELVTPEEIAQAVVWELQGGNSGHDVIEALDGSAFEPSYRAGFLQSAAVRALDQLEKSTGMDSVAFEMLGPPRLSKLLYEAYLLRCVVGSPDAVVEGNAEDIASAIEKILSVNTTLRSQILSIGVAILLPDGKRYLRGEDVKIPPYRGDDTLPLTDENVNRWCEEGWVDLRPANIATWQKRFEAILAQTRAIAPEETGSRFVFTYEYWENFATINPGKTAAWIFSYEEKGMRMKD